MLRRLALWSLGFSGALLALEAMFRILPVSTSTETGYYTDPLILTYPPNHRWVMSTGWDLRNAQALKANNFGYAADRDFVRNERAVALIGDSFIEASMLPAEKRPGAQLERAIGSRPVFAMGNPGTSLLDYAERIRFASERFGVRDFVILIGRHDIYESLCGSGNINGPCLDPKGFAARTETLPEPGTLKRIARQSALAQYLFSQLKFDVHRIWPPATHGPIAATPAPPATLNSAVMPEVEAIVRTFFARAKPYIQGKLIIVMDSDRRALYRNLIQSDPARIRFIQMATDAGASVIDTEDIFRAHMRDSPLKLDVGPYDGHLNALGVRLAFQAAADAINMK